MLILNQTVTPYPLSFNAKKWNFYPIFHNPKPHPHTYVPNFTIPKNSIKHAYVSNHIVFLKGEILKLESDHSGKRGSRKKEKSRKEKGENWKWETCLELERERGKNDCAFLLKDLAYQHAPTREESQPQNIAPKNRRHSLCLAEVLQGLSHHPGFSDS